MLAAAVAGFAQAGGVALVVVAALRARMAAMRRKGRLLSDIFLLPIQ
jgi:hypothetical protein